VSHDNGATWTPVMTNRSLPASDDSGSFNESGTGIAGSSGGVYLPLTANLPGSGAALVRFKYMTDANTGGRGVVLDNIAITGNPVDGGEAEADRNAWTYNGFLAIKDGVGITSHFNAYVAENRQYDGYDTSLKTAYNFGFLDSKPDWVEHYPYQNGMLLWYWNDAYTDNSVGDHPGSGLLLPIDSHPGMTYWPDGTLLRPRLLSYDSTFGLERTDAITVHNSGMEATIPSQPAVPVFDDSNSYWVDGSAPGRYQPRWNSVKVPDTGTQIRVKGVSAQENFMQVEVRPG
jgi:immune inhibitor A